MLSPYWLFENLFQTSFVRLCSGVSLVVIGMALIVFYSASLLPSWALFSPRLKKSACYANIRVIQTALEEYCLEHRFTPELGRDPVKVLHAAGCLRNSPSCPTPGNTYTIPPGSVLQCVGSDSHGIP
jgi:type II secretory pathway pseudopilin PulG